MRFNRLIFIIGLFLGLVANAYAAEMTAASLDKLIRLSGMAKQMQGASEQVIAGIKMAVQNEPNRLPLTPSEWSQIDAAATKWFAVDALLQPVRDTLKKNLSEQDAQTLLSWYESDLGKKITQAEEKASTMEAQQEMMAQSAGLMKKEAYVKLAQSFDKLIKATESNMTLIENSVVAGFVAGVSISNPEQQLDLAQIRQQLKSQLPISAREMEKITILSMVYSYKNIPITELEKYYAFNQQPVTQRMNVAGVLGMQSGFSRAMIGCFKAIVGIEIKARKSKRGTY